MLTAISAPPGSGKSLYCVQLIEEVVRKNPNRLIFTNIVGINIPGVLPIKLSSNQPFDWRDLPSGSLIVYDEAHEHPAFSKTDLLKNYELPQYLQDLFDAEVEKVLDYENLPSPLKAKLLNKHGFVYKELPERLLVKQQEELIRKIRTLQKQRLEIAKEEILEIGRALLMHRHWGYDIVLVTQKPDLLNAFVKAATSEHLILRRLFKMQLAIIYSFSEIQESFGNATRKNALSWKIWFFPKRLFKYYISAEEHTANASIPWLIKGPVFLFLCLVAFSIYRQMNTDFRFFKASEAQPVEEETSTANQEQPSKSDQKIEPPQQAKQLQDLSNLCRQAVNLDTPECQKWFDDLSKNGGSIGEVSTFNYDGSKPYDVEHVPTNLQPKDFPRFKNTIVYNGKCTAYSQQGTIMHQVSQSDCWRLARGDRPFDYFADKPQAVQNNNSSDTDAYYKKAYYENIARMESERVYKAQNPQFTTEPLPYDYKPPREITGTNAL